MKITPVGHWHKLCGDIPEKHLLQIYLYMLIIIFSNHQQSMKVGNKTHNIIYIPLPQKADGMTT